MKRWSKLAIACLVLLLAMAGSLIAASERIVARLAFKPEVLTGQKPPMDDIAQRVSIPTPDGFALDALFFDVMDSSKVILYLHGNSGHLYYRLPQAKALTKRGYDVLLIDYRGFGFSEGEPTEQGIYQDGQAALDYLLQQGFDAGSIFLFGRSIGSTVATYIAQHNRVGGVIFLSPLSNGDDMARLLDLEWLSWMIPTVFDNTARAPHITSPSLIIHGANDRIVPYVFGQSLYEALPPGLAEFITVPNAGHNDIHQKAGDQLWEWTDEFIQRVIAQ